MQYSVYSTGDQIWTSQRYGKRVSVKVITHDGMVWEEGDTAAFRKLDGIEKHFHTGQVWLIKLILKVIS